MTKKDYELIAGAIFRSGYVTDKNKVRQQAKMDRSRQIVTDLAASLKHDNPNFDEAKFQAACGANI